jgi:hypothetical protein
VKLALQLLVAIALWWVSPARAQELHEQPVAFADLLRAHVKSGLGLAQLPEVTRGVALDEPAVFVSVTPSKVYLHGEPVLALEGGMPRTDDIRLCKARVPCSPRLRNAIADARADLAAALGGRPAVIIIAHVRVPFATLLHVARSAAEAGAHLSVHIAGRTKAGEIVGVPVWVAPGRTLVFGRSQVPVLATAEVHGKTVAVRATRSYMERPEWARNLADLQEILGRIQLRSGRTTCFVTAADATGAADLMRAIDAIREVFPNVALADRRGVRAQAE